MPHFLLFAAIILCITVSESRIELSNSLKDSVKAAKAYYVSDYAKDFYQIPQVSSTRKLRRRNLCDKDRYHYDVYEEHRIHLMDPIFIKNNKGKCHSELEDNKVLKRKYDIHEHLGDYINASPVDIFTYKYVTYYSSTLSAIVFLDHNCRRQTDESPIYSGNGSDKRVDS
ncbi:hypothetical protein DdX_20814 [Ditylenchus destructor]|uniref:Uncharacterized protein n=1 Tax=Ditylenchus destructor TaxID=166010 RepID=A0AAD4MGJ3_9BILA|nr:hypothetical protein DdX_20814 [Ditylenchus destructor]